MKITERDIREGTEAALAQAHIKMTQNLEGREIKCGENRTISETFKFDDLTLLMLDAMAEKHIKRDTPRARHYWMRAIIFWAYIQSFKNPESFGANPYKIDTSDIDLADFSAFLMSHASSERPVVMDRALINKTLEMLMASVMPKDR